jgi:hypothetical protein
MAVAGESSISTGVGNLLAKGLAPRIFDGAGVVLIGFGSSGGCLMLPIAWEPFAGRWMNFQISGIFHDQHSSAARSFRTVSWAASAWATRALQLDRCAVKDVSSAKLLCKLRCIQRSGLRAGCLLWIVPATWQFQDLPMFCKRARPSTAAQPSKL